MEECDNLILDPKRALAAGSEEDGGSDNPPPFWLSAARQSKSVAFVVIVTRVPRSVPETVTV